MLTLNIGVVTCSDGQVSRYCLKGVALKDKNSLLSGSKFRLVSKKFHQVCTNLLLGYFNTARNEESY